MLLQIICGEEISALVAEMLAIGAEFAVIFMFLEFAEGKYLGTPQVPRPTIKHDLVHSLQLIL